MRQGLDSLKSAEGFADAIKRRCHSLPLRFGRRMLLGGYRPRMRDTGCDGGGNSVVERVISPSKITAWLDCPHYLTLRTRVEDGLLVEPDTVFGSFSRLLQAKGQLHEVDCLERRLPDALEELLNTRARSVEEMRLIATLNAFVEWAR